MNSKERMLCALDRRKPDRLPITVHQWQKYHLEEHLGGMSELEAFAKFGMDAQIQYFQSMGQFWVLDADFTKASTPEWRDEAKILSDKPDDRLVHHEVTTPGGKLTYRTAGDRKTTWITEYLIKKDEDIDLIRKYMPVSDFDPAPVNALYDEVGDRGILRGFVWGDQAGCWQHLCCLADVNMLILKCFDDPAWIHEILDSLLEKKMRFIESMKGAKFDLIETGGGASSSTLISPKLHEEFCLPYDRKMHDALRALGFRSTYHTCGGTHGIEECIVENHCNASETLAPVSVGSNQEPWDLARKIAGRVALIGGLDQHNLVTRGTREEIRAMIRKLFETVGPNGGYICSMSDHFFETPPERIQWVAETAHECVYS